MNRRSRPSSLSVSLASVVAACTAAPQPAEIASDPDSGIGATDSGMAAPSTAEAGGATPASSLGCGAEAAIPCCNPSEFPSDAVSQSFVFPLAPAFLLGEPDGSFLGTTTLVGVRELTERDEGPDDPPGRVHSALRFQGEAGSPAEIAVGATTSELAAITGTGDLPIEVIVDLELLRTTAGGSSRALRISRNTDGGLLFASYSSRTFDQGGGVPSVTSPPLSVAPHALCQFEENGCNRVGRTHALMFSDGETSLRLSPLEQGRLETSGGTFQVTHSGAQDTVRGDSGAACADGRFVDLAFFVVRAPE